MRNMSNFCTQQSLQHHSTLPAAARQADVERCHIEHRHLTVPKQVAGYDCLSVGWSSYVAPVSHPYIVKCRGTVAAYLAIASSC